MPIIQSDKSKEIDKIKIFINSSVLSEIKEYCTWASIEDISIFFEQAAEFILKKDREWKNHKKVDKR